MHRRIRSTKIPKPHKHHESAQNIFQERCLPFGSGARTWQNSGVVCSGWNMGLQKRSLRKANHDSVIKRSLVFARERCLSSRCKTGQYNNC